MISDDNNNNTTKDGDVDHIICIQLNHDTCNKTTNYQFLKLALTFMRYNFNATVKATMVSITGAEAEAQR